jgi:hypothetical protein
MTHLIWILPVIMVAIIIAATGWRPSRPNVKFNWRWIWTLVVIVVLPVWGIKSCNDNRKADKKGMKNASVCKNDEGDWVKIPTGFYKNRRSGECVEGKTSPSPLLIPTPGKRKTLYVFLPDGCVTKHLSGNWERYPKGGKIKFFDSKGKVVLVDEPGTYVPSALPAGEYRICKADPKAWGVEIWE